MNTFNPYEVDSKLDIPLSEIGSALIHQFHRHWLRLCRGDLLPRRADIDPANFKPMLPNIILADVEHDPFRVRYRLCGTKVVEFCGNLTGRYLDEIKGADLWSTAGYLQQYQTVARDGRPVFTRDWMVGQFGTRHSFQTGIWPLASDGRNVDMCVAAEDYHNLRRADMEPPMVLQAL